MKAHPPKTEEISGKAGDRVPPITLPGGLTAGKTALPLLVKLRAAVAGESPSCRPAFSPQEIPGGPLARWFSAGELAGMGLPELPFTRRGLRERAQREGWEFRSRQGRGGGVEYHADSLPPEARTEFHRRAADALTQPPQAEPRPVTPPPCRTPSGGAEKRMEARLEVLQAFDNFCFSAPSSLGEARAAFCATYNAGGTDAPQEAREFAPRISPATLAAWEKRLRREGIDALAGRYGNRRGGGAIDRCAELRGYCETQLTARPHLSASHLQLGIEADFGQSLPLRTIQRWMAHFRARNNGKLLALTNPDAWRSQRRPAFGSASENVRHLNDLWEIDATPADVMLTDGRHSIVGVIDVWSRRAMCLVTKTPRAVANTTLLRRAIAEWGLPDVLKSDNGKDFTATHMRRALETLGVRQQLCQPFSPQQKPHIERFFGTMTRGLFALLPGFTGHNVAGAQALRARRSFAQRMGEGPEKILCVSMTAEALQAAIDGWLAHVYERRPHRGIGTSPFLKAASHTGAVRRPGDERAMEVALWEAPDAHGMRVVGKKGISVAGRHYTAEELGAMTGERVQVRHDPDDASRIAVYAMNHSFVCLAECPEIAGVTPAAVAAAAQAIAGRAQQHARAAYREAKKAHRPDDLAARIVDAAALRHANVVALPGRAEPAPAGTQLQAAAEALAALEGFGLPRVAAPLSAEDRALAQEAMEEMGFAPRPERPARDAVALRPGGRPVFEDHFQFCDWALARLAAGEIDQDDLEALDEALLSPGMDLRFGAEAVAGARRRAAAGMTGMTGIKVA